MPKFIFRPPAVPLIVVDPFFSIWSFSDKLTDDTTRHWTGQPQHMIGLVRIDGRVFTICGQAHGDFENETPLPQLDLQVNPTQTLYRFEGAGIRLSITFATPAFPDDLEWLARPVTYVVFEAESVDGKMHDVELYWDVGGEIATNTWDDPVTWGRLRISGLDVMRIAAAEQQVLSRSGDNRRIDWGNAYLAIPEESGSTFLGSRSRARRHFARHGGVSANDEFEQPNPINLDWPAMVVTFDLGQLGKNVARRYFILAYDDIFSLEFLNRKLRPWWRRNGADAATLLADAAAAFPNILSRCKAYDLDTMSRLEKCGGAEYARACALAFRQCLAAHKLAADFEGAPVYLSKENFSNGCIGTVDVTYPSAPFFLWLNPKLLQAQLDPILIYAASSRWSFPFAPHDLGIYPLANGQAYGGGEKTEDNQMPVEECGNMLILVTALVLHTGDADYVRRWWPLLRQWAAYLESKGLDPENQLCTDDFAGHLAHNTNLSLKAILALGCFARLANIAGNSAEALRVRGIAEEMADRWQEMADDGDYYRLAFDVPGSWSQKYNLIWDRLLGIELFPPEVARKEMAHYRSVLDGRACPHGLPLDSRKTYTKLDWTFWTACITGVDEDFEAIISPACKWISAGISRVPLTDWYETTGDGRQCNFQARSVVGGLFIRQLTPLDTPKNTCNHHRRFARAEEIEV